MGVAPFISVRGIRFILQAVHSDQPVSRVSLNLDGGQHRKWIASGARMKLACTNLGFDGLHQRGAMYNTCLKKYYHSISGQLRLVLDPAVAPFAVSQGLPKQILMKIRRERL